MNIGIITGASSGLGEEFARQIDRLYPSLDELWLVARREERLLALKSELHHPCRIFSLDLTVDEDILELFYQVRLHDGQIQILVNSAGYGKLGEFEEVSLKDNLGMIDLNCRGLASICHQSIPFLDKGARIFNIASVAAFLPQAGFAVYAATKSFVLSFSRALNKELLPRDITVTCVCPNPMDTEFFCVADRIYEGEAIKKIGVEDPAEVVSIALKRSEKKKDISVSHLNAQLIRLSSRILPHPWIMKIEEWMGIGK